VSFAPCFPTKEPQAGQFHDSKESAVEELLLGQTYTSDLHVIVEPLAGSVPVAVFAGLAAAEAERPVGGTPEVGPSLAGYGLTSLLASLRESAPSWTLVNAEWQNVRSLAVGRKVRYELTLTRVRSGKTGGSVVSTRAALRAEDGSVLEQGICDFATPDAPGREAGDVFQIGSVEWGRQLVPYLERNEQFASAISSYDGTIGIAGGSEEVHFRLYKGTVLEVTRRAIHGSDFTLEADDGTWVDMILDDRNDFMDRAMKGQFRTRGSGYEYLRMTKALFCIIDAARAAARAAIGEEVAQ
jgi:hypothetical protein